LELAAEPEEVIFEDEISWYLKMVFTFRPLLEFGLI
jgi:hypothetical protein